MNIHETYVSLETAKLLKEAGFDWEGTSYYQHGVFYPYSIDRVRLVIMNHNSAPDYMELYSAPTLDVAQRWLREVKGIEVSTEMDDNQNDCRNCEWHCLYKINEKDYKYLMNKPFPHLKRFISYEEAQETGIKKALEIILEKRK